MLRQADMSYPSFESGNPPQGAGMYRAGWRASSRAKFTIAKQIPFTDGPGRAIWMEEGSLAKQSARETGRDAIWRSGRMCKRGVLLSLLALSGLAWAEYSAACERPGGASGNAMRPMPSYAAPRLAYGQAVRPYYPPP